MPVQQHRLGHLHFIFCQGACFVRAEYINPGQFFNGSEPGNNGLPAGKVQGTHGHGHRQHCRQGNRNGGNGQYQGKACYFNKVFMTEQGHHENKKYQGNGQDDQEISDLDNHFLEMTPFFQGRLGHQGDH